MPGFGRPPGMGGGPRPAGSAGPGGAGQKRGAAVYLLRDGRPARVAVEVGVSDGKRTEIRSSELAAGSEVITDVAESKK